MTSTYDEFIRLKENVQQNLTQIDLDSKSEAFKYELISQITLSIHAKSFKLNEIEKNPIIKRNNKSVSIGSIKDPEQYVYKYKRVILLPQSLSEETNTGLKTYIYDHKQNNNNLSKMTQIDAGFKLLM